MRSLDIIFLVICLYGLNIWFLVMFVERPVCLGYFCTTFGSCLTIISTSLLKIAWDFFGGLDLCIIMFGFLMWSSSFLVYFFWIVYDIIS